MPSEPVIIAAWLVFIVVGQWSLFVLLFTIFFVKDLPQRKNPFLVNFLLTTFLGTIPPSILLYTGHQSARTPPSNSLCSAQAALVDGVAPMFAAAQLALVIDTWSEHRSIALYKRRIMRYAPLKYTLILCPYVVMWTWVFASLITATQSKATHVPGFVYCINNSGPSNAVREYVGVFMLVCGMIELAFGLCAGLLLYRSSTEGQKDLAAWRPHLHFSLRLVTLSFLQLTAVILSVGSAGLRPNPFKPVYELLTSMNPLATFLVFSTQRTILQAWKICRKTEPVFEFTTGSSPAYAADKVREQRRTEVFEEALQHGAVDGYFKPWLRVEAAS